MKGTFAHLRVSSEYSIFKGILSIEKLVEKAKQHGMPAIALTDHNNMFGLVKFFKKCEKKLQEILEILKVTTAPPGPPRILS